MKQPQNKRSAIMRSIKSKETLLEIDFRKKLSSLGLRYRKNVSYLPGKPDIAFINKKVVIFIDSCFWHGCKKHMRMPKTNLNYWVPKIERNRARDKEIIRVYKKLDWKIIRIWEHQLKTPQTQLKKILQAIK